MNLEIAFYLPFAFFTGQSHLKMSGPKWDSDQGAQTCD